jgi:tRNA G18 (ribose-2'-O)-methylase SpoU
VVIRHAIVFSCGAVVAAGRRCEQLMQAVLAKTFAGKL